ncbi:SH3 domain-containing kinase-binding protein 1-like, partial [Apodemus sylvaticus]|uniref:SH3 domain-containing kinase-binding protein 1-like n=1 Tax=Apodemus sylvaticus TaxID=10129 RepID=UPI002241B6E1
NHPDVSITLFYLQTIGKKLPPATSTPDPSKTEMDSRTKTKDYCKVIFPYEAQNDDELTIKEGDIVTLINKDCIDVGWWEGELNGRRGVFPDNFVKLLPPDFDKEGNRPKKPPPPSAPVLKQGAGTTERKHEIKKIPPERPETLPNRTEEKERPEREPKLDLQKPSVPAIPPKKPRPPKTNSLNRPGALPPRRPERPVGPLTHTRYCHVPTKGHGMITGIGQGMGIELCLKIPAIFSSEEVVARASTVWVSGSIDENWHMSPRACSKPGHFPGICQNKASCLADWRCRWYTLLHLLDDIFACLSYGYVF